MPTAALTSDMQMFYAPDMSHSKQATVTDTACASVCITSMICFAPEKTYGGTRNLDEVFAQNGHRVCARGNVSS